MEPNYMDIIKIVDYTITRVVIEIEKAYTQESRDEYLEKYECQSTKELVYLLLCEMKPSELNISLNMRQKINNISQEANHSESEDEHLQTTITQILQDKDELVEKIKSLKELFSSQNIKIQELIQINSTLTTKLKNQSTSNNLDVGL